MKEYKMAKGWAIFIYIFAPLLIALFTWPLLLPFIPEQQIDLKLYLFLLLPISIGMIVLAVLGIIDTYKGRLIIKEDRILTKGVARSRELLLKEIKGFRVNENYIFIESNDKSKKKIKVSTYYGNTGELIMWLANHYPDLDTVSILQEKQEILEEEAFGRNVEERSYQLGKAKKAAKPLNWLGGIAAVWALFYPQPYEFAMAACVLIPWLAIVLIRVFKGLIRLDQRDNSAYPSVAIAVLFPGICLALRALLDFNIDNYSNVWLPSILIAAAMLLMALLGNKEFRFKRKSDYFTIFSILGILFAYGYGSVLSMNILLDDSKPEIYTSSILEKRINSGKTTTYHFKLSTWREQTEAEEVTVDRELYEKLEEKEEVTIYYRKGKLDIPWFIVSEE